MTNYCARDDSVTSINTVFFYPLREARSSSSSSTGSGKPPRRRNYKIAENCDDNNALLRVGRAKSKEAHKGAHPCTSRTTPHRGLGRGSQRIGGFKRTVKTNRFTDARRRVLWQIITIWRFEFNAETSLKRCEIVFEKRRREKLNLSVHP